MFRKVVAASFVTIWLVLFGIEFSEDMGLIEYSEPQMDESVNATLASLGEAIQISDDTRNTPSDRLSALPVAFYPSAIDTVSFQCLRKETQTFEEDIPFYKRHRVFLI